MQKEENYKTIIKKLTQTKKFMTLTHHNKSTQKIAKTIKKLEYNIAYTTKKHLQKTPHKQNHTQHHT